MYYTSAQRHAWLTNWQKGEVLSAMPHELFEALSDGEELDIKLNDVGIERNGLKDQVRVLSALADRLIADGGKTTDALLNLLAIIHRDGGEHTSHVGQEQSVKDAREIVRLLFGRAERAEKERDTWKEEAEDNEADVEAGERACVERDQLRADLASTKAFADRMCAESECWHTLAAHFKVEGMTSAECIVKDVKSTYDALLEEVLHWKSEHAEAVRREASAVWDIDQVKEECANVAVERIALRKELEQQKADYQRLADGTEESQEWHEMRDMRDAAMAERDALRKDKRTLDDLNDTANESAQAAYDMRQERDEAIAERDRLREELAISASSAKLNKTEREKLRLSMEGWDAAIARAEKAERERDLSKAEVKDLEMVCERFRAIACQITLNGSGKTIADLGAERDALRAQIAAATSTEWLERAAKAFNDAIKKSDWATGKPLAAACWAALEAKQ